jgi:hypothetical protein
MTATQPLRSSNLPSTDPARRAPATPDWLGRSFIVVTSLAWFITCILLVTERGRPLQVEAFGVGSAAVTLTVLTVAVKLRWVLLSLMVEIGGARRRDWWSGYKTCAVSFQRAEIPGDEDPRVY